MEKSINDLNTYSCHDDILDSNLCLCHNDAISLHVHMYVGILYSGKFSQDKFSWISRFANICKKFIQEFSFLEPSLKIYSCENFKTHGRLISLVKWLDTLFLLYTLLVRHYHNINY